jgi:plasmid stabilization system protein ParE
MRLFWSTNALNDLVRLGEYISNDNAGAANRFVSRLWNRAKTIKNHPRLGRKVPETDREDIRELIEGNHRIIYIVADKAITVIAVVEGHRILNLNISRS